MFGEIIKLTNAHDRTTVQQGDFETFTLGNRNTVGMTTSPDDQQVFFFYLSLSLSLSISLSLSLSLALFFLYSRKTK